jgi:hypothetical protein
MNERIKDLIDQATIVTENFYDSEHGYYTHRKFDKEKFAELIIKECTSKCEFVANMATITNSGEMARKTKATADSCATMIKTHFGVEE